MPAALTRRPSALAVAAVLLLTLVLASMPFAYAYRHSPPGYRFWAVPAVNSSDANQYLAFTRTVSEGHLLFGDPFTTEPHPPRLFLPQVAAQAVLCRLTGCTPLDAFQVSRVLSGALLLLAGWWFSTLFLPRGRLWWLYLGLLCFSAGAGWFADRMGYFYHGDASQPESNTFYMLGNLPHLALSAALLTALFGSLRAYERQTNSKWLWFAAGAALLLSWTHPFDFVTLALGLGTYAAIRWIQYRRIPLASLRHGAAVFVGLLPAALYLGWLTATEPIYRALANDVLKVLDFNFYAVAHGPLLIPALVVLAVPRLRSRYLLPLCWVTCVFLFLLTPFRMGGKQPRLLGGIHVPLALLAAVGVDTLGRAIASGLRTGLRGRPKAERLSALRLRRGLAGGIAGFFLVCTATGVYAMVQRHLAFYAAGGPGFYMSPAVQGLFAYLGREGRRDQVTLGGDYTGGWAPTWADTPVYFGHWHMTLHAAEKIAQRNWLFTGATDTRSYTGTADVAARAEWLRRNRISWIIWYPWEWNGYSLPLDGVPGISRAYSSPEILLYRFQPVPNSAAPPIQGR